MNTEEAKQILMIYRPGTRDAEDPEVAAALQMVEGDAELSRWFAEHCTRQIALREKFRQIPLPAGLKEQIVSEQAAAAGAASRKQKIVGLAAVAATIVAITITVITNMPSRPRPVANNLANYLSLMADSASSSYYMHAATNSDQIRSYLGQNQAPSDYVLPANLQKVALSGCAVEIWQKSRASMICFKTHPLPANEQSDLWLFVIDSSAVKDASAITSRQFAQAGGLTTAVWTQDGKLYILGTKGDEQTLQKFL